MKANTVVCMPLKHVCRDCGWPAIDVCCNDEMSEPPYGEWDWWMYCLNKGCKNHAGEGFWQSEPDWVKDEI